MSWAHYLLQANIYLVVFYAFYKLLLDKETYFTLNRIYLVSAGILSFGLPFVRLSWFRSQTIAQPVYDGMDQLAAFTAMPAPLPEGSASVNIGSILVLIYLSGVVVFSLKLLYQLLKVNRLLKTNARGAAFSFFNRTVIDPALPELETIQHHEDIHSRQLHSMDVLVVELLSVITWFNPIIYLYKRSLKSIHEYLADAAAAQFIGDKQKYALLLVSSSFGVPLSTLTHSFFNKSLLKNRIYMLNQRKSTKAALLKYGLCLPLFGTVLVFSSATLRDNEKLQAVAAQIPNGNVIELVEDVVKPQATGWDDFYAYIKSQLQNGLGLPKDKLNGVTHIKFSLKNKAVEGTAIAGKAIGGGVDAAVMKAVLSYPKFDTLEDGNYLLTVAFRQADGNSTDADIAKIDVSGYTNLNTIVVISDAKANGEDTKVYDFTSLDQHPSFPGGMDKFYKYLKENVKYPAEAAKNNIQGKVFLSLIVEKDGQLSNINVDRKVSPELDKEAIRVLTASPKWHPGKVGGQTVRVKYHIPISFALSNGATINATKSAGDVIGILKGNNQNPSEVVVIGNGANSPLYYIDGVKGDAATLKALNPNEIAHIDVIKDASATTLYGEEAKYGVIKITTKAAQESKNENSVTDKKKE